MSKEQTFAENVVEVSALDHERLKRYETSVKINDRLYQTIQDLEREQKRLWLVQDTFRSSLTAEYKKNADLRAEIERLKQARGEKT